MVLFSGEFTLVSKLFVNTNMMINYSASSVTRHKRHWNIKGSRVTTAMMEELDKRQLVFDEMAKDPNAKRGPKTVKENIALISGVHLTRFDFQLLKFFNTDS